MEKPLSPAALSVRRGLLAAMDRETVSRIINSEVGALRIRIHDTGAGASTQAVSVVLLARLLIATEGAHIARSVKAVPEPEIHAALWSLATDPPIEFEEIEVPLEKKEG